MIIQIFSDLVDAELPALNKPIRRHTLQECLHKMLLLTLDWDICDALCLNNAILPYIRLQTKILRRRGVSIFNESHLCMINEFQIRSMSRCVCPNFYFHS